MHPLHQNASSFFDKIFDKYQNKMECANGCYKCCVVTLSIFPWEAAIIIDWFNSLEHLEQVAVIEKWNSLYDNLVDLDGNKNTPCVFLSNKSCSIYPARPIICRTQGAPLFIEGQLENCPLNFKDFNVPKEDALHLERLNFISSQLQIQFGDHPDFPELGRIPMSDIKKLIQEKFSSKNSDKA